jgi:hypothetical protein
MEPTVAQLTPPERNPANFEDGHASRLWELLRRNRSFAAKAMEFKDLLDQRKKNPYLADAALGLLLNLERHHLFAAFTLRWMVPAILLNKADFSVRFPSLIKRMQQKIEDESRGKEFQCSVSNDPQLPNDRLLRALTSFPFHLLVGTDAYAPTRPVNVDNSLTFGPLLIEGADLTKSDFNQLGLVSLEMGWRELPIPFRRGFQWFWSIYENAAPSSFPNPQGNPFKVQVSTLKEITSSFMILDNGWEPALSQIKGQYDLFGIDRIPPLLSLGEIDQLAAEFKEKLKEMRRGTVISGHAAPSLFGTEGDWEVFLFCEDALSAGSSPAGAYGHYERLWKRKNHTSSTSRVATHAKAQHEKMVKLLEAVFDRETFELSAILGISNPSASQAKSGSKRKTAR